MKRICIFFLLFFTAIPVMAQSSYVIGPGDVLDISVWRDDALTKTVTVLPDGNISYPLIGRVMAGGRTVDVLELELCGKLNRYVPDPELTVSVREVNSMHVSVLGRVNRPGRFMLGENIGVLEALAMSGGLTPYAKEKSIRIFRRDGKTYDFDYKRVTRGKDKDFRLEKGDVIVVP